MAQGFAAEIGLVNMLPVHDKASANNVGVSWNVTSYTVPTGRVFVVDSAMVLCFAGTLPTASEILVYDDSSTLQGWVARSAYTTVNTPIYLSGPIWLVEDWTLRFQNVAGDSTTDMIWSFSGRLFDAV